MRDVFGNRAFTSILICLLICAAAVAEEATFESAVAVFKAGDYDEAARQFEVLVEQNPEWAPGLQTLGQCYYLLGRPEDGGSKLDQARELDPDIDLYMAYYAVGQTLYQKREYERSIAPLERALDLADPEQRPKVATNLAYANLKSKRYAEARELLQGRDDLEPRERRYLAIACQRTGDYDCALVTLRGMRDSAADAPGDVLKDLAEWSRYWALKSSNADRRSALLGQAAEDTRGWFDAAPESAEALRVHADVLLAAERSDELIALLLPRARGNPNDCAARLFLAIAYNAQRNSVEAETWAREAIACSAQSVDALLELAVALMRQVGTDFSTTEAVDADLLLLREATDVVERARSMDPGNTRAAALAEDLRAATARLREVAAALVANNTAHETAVAAMRLEEIRKRCKNILWKMNDESRALPDDDRIYYDRNNCKQYAAP